MRHAILTFAVLTLALLSQKASATTFAEEDFICPIGGEKFTAQVVMSNSMFGSRPDGKPYSPLPVYPITECPGNGFLIFKEEWTEGELAILGEAINTDEFERIRQEETQYYRLWWLQKQIGADATTLANNLMVASWETDFDKARKRRYQQGFVEAAAAITKDDGLEDWFWLNLRAANVLRELGQFDRAKDAFAVLGGEIAVFTDADEKEYISQFLKDQMTLIDERNTASEPAHMVGEDNAVWRCALYEEELTASELPVCASEKMQSEIANTTIETEEGKTLKGKEAIQYVWGWLSTREGR